MFVSIMIWNILGLRVHKFVFVSRRCLDFQLHTLFRLATLTRCVNSSP